MNRYTLTIFAITSVLILSCDQDFTTATVTYTRATGVYGDLDEIRQTSLVTESQEIINPGKIFVADNLLLIGEENEGIHVVDNSDPENPQNSLFINVPGNKEFYVYDNNIYAESYYDMLKIDISQINQPQLVSRVENAFVGEFQDPQGQTLLGFTFEEVTEKLSRDDEFFRIVQQNEILYFDFQDRLIPESAVPASFAGNSNQAIGSVNRIAYNNGHVYVISRSILTTFNDNGVLEKVSSEYAGWQMETIYPYEDLLFIGTQNSMQIMGLEDPDQPTYVSEFQHADSCDPVYPVDDNVAYVTLRTGDIGNCPGDVNAIVVVDITTIQNPRPTQEIAMESPFGMTMIGDDLFVGEGQYGLKQFDASNRRNLVLKQWDESIEAYDVIPHPTRTDIVLIAGPEGLSQYSVNTNNSFELLSRVLF